MKRLFHRAGRKKCNNGTAIHIARCISLANRRSREVKSASRSPCLLPPLLPPAHPRSPSLTLAHLRLTTNSPAPPACRIWLLEPATTPPAVGWQGRDPNHGQTRLYIWHAPGAGLSCERVFLPRAYRERFCVLTWQPSARALHARPTTTSCAPDGSSLQKGCSPGPKRTVTREALM